MNPLYSLIRLKSMKKKWFIISRSRETLFLVLSVAVEWILRTIDLVDGQRISNGPVEGINSRIDKILSNACEYQNFARMRNRLMYSLNKFSNPSSYAIDETIKREGKKRGSYKKKNQ